MIILASGLAGSHTRMIKEVLGMGIYRRKNKGKPYGPYIVQYPYMVDPATGKTKYTTLSAGFSKRVAKQIFAHKTVEWKRKKHLGLEAKKDYTFRELVDWYAKLPSTLKLRSSRTILIHCRTLKDHFGDMLATEIKPYLIEDYQQRRLSQTSLMGTLYKPASVNREMQVMKRIFNLAIREDFVEKNPCLKISKLPEDNVRDRILSYQEFLTLTGALPQYAADIVRMAYFTGMRFGEIVGLTFDRVNLKEGYLSLMPEDTKTKEPRRVFLMPEAVEVLQRASKVRGITHNYVFTHEGRPVKRFRAALKKALEETGIQDFRFHDLRHTFNTNMRRAGVERSVIMKLTGHKTLSMFLRYSTVDDEDAREAVTKFADFLERMEETTSNSTSQNEGGRIDKD